MSLQHDTIYPHLFFSEKILERISYAAKQLVTVYNFPIAEQKDLEQALALQLLHAASNYTPEKGAPVTFAKRVLHDACVMLMRRRAKYGVGCHSKSTIVLSADEKRRAEKCAFRSERECFARASRLNRRIAVLYLRGLSKRQIAAYLGIPKSTFCRKTWQSFCTEMRKRLITKERR